MDNYAAHKRVEIRDWLARATRGSQVHFTPTSGSWLNLVEVWFGIIERQAIHRGSFGSVTDLTAAIRAFIDGWNDRCHPFVWTKTADELLDQSQPESNPPDRRTPWVWGQTCPSGSVWRVSKVIGLCIPMLEWRRFGLYQHSIHSKMALASSSRVCHVLESSSSSCIVPQNDSIIALS